MTTTNTTPFPAVRTGHWLVDHDHSSLGFSIRHLGISKVRGRFGFDADVVIGEPLDTSSVTVTVDLASIDTANAVRDDHVRAPDLLDVERRPTMTFRSTGLRLDNHEEGRIDGELTIGEITKPLTLDVAFGGIQDAPMGGPRHAGFEVSGQIRRSDYDIAPSIPSAMLGDVVWIVLDLQLLEPEDT